MPFVQLQLGVIKKKLFFMVRLTVSVDNPPITPPYSQGVVIFSK